MTDERKQEWKAWLISFVSENQPYTDSAMDELNKLTDEFIDTIENHISPDFEVYDYIDYLGERMTDTNKRYFWLKPCDDEHSDEFYDRYLGTQLNQIVRIVLKKGHSDED